MYAIRGLSRSKYLRNSKPSYRRRRFHTLSKEQKFFLAVILVPTVCYVLFSLLTLNDQIHSLRSEIKHFKTEQISETTKGYSSDPDIDNDNPSTRTIDIPSATTESDSIDIVTDINNDLNTQKSSASIEATSILLGSASPSTNEQDIEDLEAVPDVTELTSTDGFDMFAQVPTEELLLSMGAVDTTINTASGYPRQTISTPTVVAIKSNSNENNPTGNIQENVLKNISNRRKTNSKDSIIGKGDSPSSNSEERILKTTSENTKINSESMARENINNPGSNTKEKDVDETTPILLGKVSLPTKEQDIENLGTLPDDTELTSTDGFDMFAQIPTEEHFLSVDAVDTTTNTASGYSRRTIPLPTIVEMKSNSNENTLKTNAEGIIPNSKTRVGREKNNNPTSNIQSEENALKTTSETTGTIAQESNPTGNIKENVVEDISNRRKTNSKDNIIAQRKNDSPSSKSKEEILKTTSESTKINSETIAQDKINNPISSIKEENVDATSESTKINSSEDKNYNPKNAVENILKTTSESPMKHEADITQHKRKSSIKEKRKNSKKIKPRNKIVPTILPEIISTVESSLPIAPHRHVEYNTSQKEKHIRNHLTCHIPKLLPFDPSILKYVAEPEEYDCTAKYKLIFYTDLDSNLILNASLHEKNISYCCYRNLSRGKTDDKFRIDDSCTRIENKKTKIPTSFEFIAVFCHNDTSENEEIVDMFGFVHDKPDVEKRIKESNARSANSENIHKVNVVILGLDAISHMNFIRTMPKTHSYISKNLKGIPMNGFTKLGDNTLPNLLPVLTGQTKEEAKLNCYNKTGHFDDCPFIWNNFSDAGYRTFYAEDAPDVSTFNYGSVNGFKKRPTDYHIRPLMKALQKSIASHHSMNVDLCFGPRLTFEILLDYLKKAIYTFGNDKNYFCLWWSNGISHDKLNNPKMGDELLFNTLRWMSAGNYLNNTILIAMSDHGIRWGDIRKTYQGIIEERMPFLYTVFPKWFSDKYKSAVRNFKLNSERLTTPFDLHETLKDLLHLENLENHKLNDRNEEMLFSMKSPALNSSQRSQRGISLFLPISTLRDCKQAEIPEHNCVCHDLEPISLENNAEIYSASKSILNAVNERISNFSQCSLLGLKSIVSAHKIVSTSKVIQDKILLEEKKGRSRKNIINIIARPGNGNFEATVFKNRTGNNWVVLGDISRTNLYGNQSHCVTDNDVKKYCYCK